MASATLSQKRVCRYIKVEAGGGGAEGLLGGWKPLAVEPGTGGRDIGGRGARRGVTGRYRGAGPWGRRAVPPRGRGAAGGWGRAAGSEDTCRGAPGPRGRHGKA